MLCGAFALLPTHTNQFPPALHHLSPPLYHLQQGKGSCKHGFSMSPTNHSCSTPTVPSSHQESCPFTHILFPIFATTVYLWRGNSLIMSRAAQVKGSCLKPSWNLSTDWARPQHAYLDLQKIPEFFFRAWLLCHIDVSPLDTYAALQ